MKHIKKAIKNLRKIENPSEAILDIIKALESENRESNEIVFGTSYSVAEIKEVSHEKIELFLEDVTDSTKSYAKRRAILTDILEAGFVVSFDYEKKDSTSREVTVEWNDDYTYDEPKEEADFIYMYDLKDDFFKHFKLDKITNLVCSQDSL